MKAKEKEILKYCEYLFNRISPNYFKTMFVGYVPFGNLAVDFDWVEINQNSFNYYRSIMCYRMLEGACEMALRCGFDVRFNLATRKVRVENV